MLTHRFNDALVFACDLHRTQLRKSRNTPYISHLLAVSGLVMENGGDEDLAIAALLHDAVEDQGGMDTEAIIRKKFGGYVADIVLECSDQVTGKDEPWWPRKRAYLASIPSKSQGAVMVTTCDKIHNASTVLVDLKHEGLSVFDRFTTGQEGTLWYYRSLADTLLDHAPTRLGRQLDDVVSQMEAKVASINEGI
nr:HD domain-containing protein [uncultured Shimia sp.]